jgi:MFS family permease
MRRIVMGNWALFLGIALLLVANGLLLTLLTVRANELGFSATAIGVMQAGYPAGALAGTLLAPRLIERAGHVRAFAALAATCSVTAIVHLITEDVATWTAMRVLAGICFPGLYVITESWLNAQAGNRERGRVLSVYFVLQSGGAAAGAALVGVPGAGATVLFGVASILISLAVVPLLLSRVTVPPHDRPDPMSLARLYRISPMAVSGAMLNGAAMGVLFITAPLYMLELGVERAVAATLVSVMTLVGAAAQYPVGWVSDRIDRRWALLILSVTGAMLGLAAVPLGAQAGLLLLSGVAAVCVPTYSVCLAHANDQLAPSQIVPAGGAMAFSLNLGLLGGAFAGPAAVDAVGPAGFPALLALLFAATALVAAARRATTARPDGTGRAQRVGGFGAPQTSYLQSEAAVEAEAAAPAERRAE